MNNSLSLLSVISIVLLIIALTDIMKRKFKNLSFGLVWLFTILFIPLVGPAVYLSLRNGMGADRPRKFNPTFHKSSSTHAGAGKDFTQINL
jgi:beta-lactamase regulating signal transducer with metallopeptidase domain